MITKEMLVKPLLIREELLQGRLCIGGRVALRPVYPDDGLLVSHWRNMPLARQSFFQKHVVTPDSHIRWLSRKDPLDMVWIVEERLTGDPIGMVSLRICGLNMGEYGRLFIDPLYQGQGYATEIEYNFLALSFEFFQLDKVWAELISDNAAIIALHKKTGWRTMGVDLPGHTHSGTPVVLIEYDRAIWAERRQAFYASLNLETPAWTI